MRNGNAVQLGCGRYIQNKNALEIAGEEIRYFGKKAFIIGGETALKVSFDKIKTSLDRQGINYRVYIFKGFCTIAQINNLAEMARKFGADVIVGVGGGKCLDTAKGVANVLDLRVITIPTSAATCAAYAVLSVIYSDDGMVLGNMFHKHEVASVIVDMDLIAQNCPPRMLASGIGDAIAKYPEITFSMDYSKDWERSVLPLAAIQLSKHNTDVLLEKGKKAIEDVTNCNNSPEVEDVVCTNIALTGVASGLVSGGKQLGLAHTVYDCICAYFKEHQRKYLHGELVSAAIPFQMAVNGFLDEKIDSIKCFLSSINLPVSLKDIQLEKSDKNIGIFVKYIMEKMDLQNDNIKTRIRKCMEVLF